ncbi:class F sortase [Arthrobacter bambusae]|uniref:Class F sortase n=1 Tax=Arthrobacter bambusae TaxID=1338426 RepID=A0AAW8DDJ3_9MICC|nr:class F sortase [Arthrobacter bambusae]MDP9904699.1 hypothetical protein [Arthrobacter bambusae]MDQ0129515.1 hypothetical protein [Arthrobacter bambusae]MDQ0180872.1 hypothetical protein [Arthrobacter bambusae]
MRQSNSHSGRNLRKRSRGQWRWILAAVVVTAGLACAALAVLGFTQATSHDETPAPVHPFTASDPNAYTGTPTAPALPPSTLAVPGIGLQMPLNDEGTDKDGWLVIPDSDHAVHFEMTALPGAAHGTALVGGHVNYASGKLAPMAGINKVTKGMPIYVTDKNGTLHRYRAETLQNIPKDGLPQSYFAKDGTPRLVLLTCDQNSPVAPVWGVEQYTDFTVVTATPWP